MGRVVFKGASKILQRQDDQFEHVTGVVQVTHTLSSVCKNHRLARTTSRINKLYASNNWLIYILLGWNLNSNGTLT